MRYIKAVNVWDIRINSALKAGIIKLQSGQPIKCGENQPLSVFDYIDLETGYIRAYHGRSYRHALAKYKTAKAMQKLNKAFKEGLISLDVMLAGFDHASRRFQVVK